jgi:predicted DNA-binding transcriptional regulator AlpA
MVDRPIPAEPEVYKVLEVAALLQIGRRQAYEAIICREIPGCHKIGNSVRCSKVVIERWLAGASTDAAAIPPSTRGGERVTPLTALQRARLSTALHEAVERVLDDFGAETD